MKEIKVEVTKYVAQDGTRFDDKESCEKHDAECFQIDEDCATRIALIKQKRKSLDDEAEAFKRKQELELEGMYDRIRSLSKRIDALIAVGNELKRNKITPEKIVGCGWGCTNYVGFNKPYPYADDITELDVCLRIEPLGLYTFSTDGETMRFNCKIDISHKIRACERFLEDFTRFESELYGWVDEYTK